MRLQRASTTAAILCMALLSAVSLYIGCGEDEKSPTEIVNPSDVSTYLASLPAWWEFCPNEPDQDIATGDASTDFDGEYFCRTTPYSITRTPGELVTFGTLPDVLNLGMLIQGDSYLAGLSSLEELPISQRAPLTIIMDLVSGGEVTRTVQNPDAAAIQSALTQMIAYAEATGAQSGTSVDYNAEEMYSLHQATLSLGLSFKYLGATATSQLDISTAPGNHTLAACFAQDMFEAYIVQPQSPQAFFSADFTPELLQEQVALGNIGPDNIPVYVARVRYGRLMMFTMSSSREVDSMRLALEAGYQSIGNGGPASIDDSYLDILESSQYTMATIGGSDSTAIAALKSGNLDNYFASDDPITTAKPIAYCICNLADNSLATVSETTAYDLGECHENHLEFFVDWGEWIAAFNLSPYPTSTITFQTDSAHLVLASEVYEINESQTQLPAQITFLAPNTGLDFDFYLKSLAVNCPYPLSYNDNEMDGVSPGFISIGDVDNCEDDDFEIAITNNADDTYVFAMGFILGNNELQLTEELQVWYGFDQLAVYSQSGGQLPPTQDEVFVGIVSTTPITKLVFLENAGSDDIYVRNFYFGVAHMGH